MLLWLSADAHGDCLRLPSRGCREFVSRRRYGGGERIFQPDRCFFGGVFFGPITTGVGRNRRVLGLFYVQSGPPEEKEGRRSALNFSFGSGESLRRDPDGHESRKVFSDPTWEAGSLGRHRTGAGQGFRNRSGLSGGYDRATCAPTPISRPMPRKCHLKFAGCFTMQIRCNTMRPTGYLAIVVIIFGPANDTRQPGRSF